MSRREEPIEWEHPAIGVTVFLIVIVWICGGFAAIYSGHTNLGITIFGSLAAVIILSLIIFMPE
jgi:hypothetical protein